MNAEETKPAIKSRLRIYLSGPITQGSRSHNVYQANVMQEVLMRDGRFAPLNPMLTTTAPFAWEPWATHDTWIECDLPWIAVADAVVRLPGESKGADAEVDYALANNVPVFLAEHLDLDRLEFEALRRPRPVSRPTRRSWLRRLLSR
jgi:hypothetical protein